MHINDLEFQFIIWRSNWHNRSAWMQINSHSVHKIQLLINASLFVRCQINLYTFTIRPSWKSFILVYFDQYILCDLLKMSKLFYRHLFTTKSLYHQKPLVIIHNHKSHIIGITIFKSTTNFKICTRITHQKTHSWSRSYHCNCIGKRRCW